MADLLRDHRPKLGHSGHENTYRQNVLVGNWAEDRSAKESPNLPGLPIGERFHGETTTGASYTAGGKTGRQLAESAARWDLKPDGPNPSIGRGYLIDHRGHGEAPHEEAATISSYAYVDPREQTEPIQSQVWSGTKRDLHRSTSKQATIHGSQRRHGMQQEAEPTVWEASPEMRDEHSRAAAQAALRPPQRSGAQPDPNVAGGGRKKASGEFMKSVESPYFKLGLRK